ncbi:MAG: iron-containing alcohol dehydrogenase [Clostridia bacterium]|nr:iron-containing alcohol dehydrogenase [Clostridia bacterium]
MKLIKKIYCRAYQEGFRIAMPFLPYRKPLILHDVTELPALYRKQGCNKPFLVTDKSIIAHGLTDSLIEAFHKEKMDFELFDDTVANPTSDVIEEGVRRYKATGCDSLIGFGGGSSIDTAKAIGACIARPDKTLAQITGNLKVHKKLPYLSAIPTTAGTGSECTLAAIITDSKTHRKRAMNSFSLLPKCAVLDPKLTITLPPHLTSTTGVDAMTHAIEAYIGQSTTRETRAEALEAVKLVFGNVEKAYRNGADLEARANMLQAAYLAGDAFTKSYVGYVHAVAHSLGGQYNIPHGLANAVLLPIVLKEYGSCVWKKLHQIADYASLSKPTDSDEAAANTLIQAILDLNKRMNIPTKLEGIREEDLPVLTRNADKEGNPLYPVPTLWDAKQLEKIYRLVMK